MLTRDLKMKHSLAKFKPSKRIKLQMVELGNMFKMTHVFFCFENFLFFCIAHNIIQSVFMLSGNIMVISKKKDIGMQGSNSIEAVYLYAPRETCLYPPSSAFSPATSTIEQTSLSMVGQPV